MRLDAPADHYFFSETASQFVTMGVVKRRLRLASISSMFHEIYAEDAMTLEKIAAFPGDC